MQPIPEELLKVLSERLKLGERAKPVCRVEVDRLAFIPGRIQKLNFVTVDFKTEKEIVRQWIEPVSEVYKGSTFLNRLPFVFPLEGYTLDSVPITDTFGGTSNHGGIDFGVPVGTPVKATWAGKVVKLWRERYQGYGYAVDILHENGIMTRYAHLDKINV